MKFFIIEDDSRKNESWFHYAKTIGIEAKDIVSIGELPDSEARWEDYLLREITKIKYSKENILLLLDENLYDRRDFYGTEFLVKKLVEERILEKSDYIICNSKLKDSQFEDLRDILKESNPLEINVYGEKAIEVEDIKIINFDNFKNEERFIKDLFLNENPETSNGGVEITNGGLEGDFK